MSGKQVIDELPISRQQVAKLINWVVATNATQATRLEKLVDKVSSKLLNEEQPFFLLCNYNLTCDLSIATTGVQIITSCKCLMQSENQLLFVVAKPLIFLSYSDFETLFESLD